MGDIELKDAFPVQNATNDETSTGIRNMLIAGKSDEATQKVRPMLVDQYGVPYLNQKLYNGNDWDNKYNNHEVTVLSHSARTTTISTGKQINYNAKGIAIFIDVTEITGSPSLTPKVQWEGPVTGSKKDIWKASNPITGIGDYVYLLYPGPLTKGEWTEVASMVIPREWYLIVDHSNGDSITYSVAYSYQV